MRDCHARQQVAELQTEFGYATRRITYLEDQYKRLNKDFNMLLLHLGLEITTPSRQIIKRVK